MMVWLEIFLIGVALSMDALAVSVVLGAAERRALDWKRILLVAFFFGGFQALMPLAGWFGCGLLGSIVHRYGRWVAAVLLWLVGGKMIYDRNSEESVVFGLRELLVMAFATSIDAFLVGVGFACLGRDSILMEISVIGMTTLVISAGGCVAGRCFGRFLKPAYCLAGGGVVLILIGLKTLLLD